MITDNWINLFCGIPQNIFVSFVSFKPIEIFSTTTIWWYSKMKKLISVTYRHIVLFLFVCTWSFNMYRFLYNTLNLHSKPSRSPRLYKAFTNRITICRLFRWILLSSTLSDFFFVIDHVILYYVIVLYSTHHHVG